MKNLQRSDVIAILLEAFSLHPIPKPPEDAKLLYDTIYDFRVFKHKAWTEVSVSDIENSWGFSPGRYEVDNYYYFYYLPGAIAATYNDKDYYHVTIDSLMPKSKNYKINQQWLDFIVFLGFEKIKKLIELFEILKSSVRHANTMETEILIDILENFISPKKN